MSLYQAVNAMMAKLGADGEITTRSPLVIAVMDELHEIDGGVYDLKARLRCSCHSNGIDYCRQHTPGMPRGEQALL